LVALEILKMRELHVLIMKLLLGLLKVLLCGSKLFGQECKFLTKCEVVLLVCGDQGLGDLRGFLLHKALLLEITYVLLSRSVDTGFNGCC
jgi:hypothetical protein